MPSTYSERCKRICYICEPAGASLTNAHMVKCIIYEYEKNGNVLYASSMFKRESRKDMYVKQKQKDLTEKRFREEHKFVSIEINDKNKIEKEIVKKLHEITENEHI